MQLLTLKTSIEISVNNLKTALANMR